MYSEDINPDITEGIEKKDPPKIHACGDNCFGPNFEYVTTSCGLTSIVMNDASLVPNIDLVCRRHPRRVTCEACLALI